MSFDSVVKPLFELLKQPLRFSVALGIVVAIVLFAPNSIMNQLGLLKYRDEGKLYLGVALLVCVVLVIASGIGVIGEKFNDYRFLSAGKKRLHRLTVEEKQILRGYIERQTRSLYFNVGNGVINGLVQEGIVYRSSSVSNPNAGFMAFSHNIQPWAWDYLNDHRDLLGP